MVTAKNFVHIPKRWAKLQRQNILPLHCIRVKEFIQNYFKNQQLWDSFLTAKNPSLLGKKFNGQTLENKRPSVTSCRCLALSLLYYHSFSEEGETARGKSQGRCIVGGVQMANSRKIRSLELEFTWNGTQLSITTSQDLLPSVYLFPPLNVSYRACTWC